MNDPGGIIEKHVEVVGALASGPTTSALEFSRRMYELTSSGSSMIRFPHALCASMGLSGESGEILDKVKKILFQGKDPGEHERQLLMAEVGDVAWYLQLLCIALETTFTDALLLNIDKLNARYPGLAFSVERSENRKEGDV